MEKSNNKFRIKSIIHYMVISLLAITLFLVISSKSQKAFELIGYRTYTVLSGSMEPEFYPGDVVIIKNKKRIKFKENDIATFVDDGEVVTHRIIEKTREGYITKGDNNDVEDATILKDENIVGKVVLSIPKVGYIIQFLSKPMVIAAEMVLLAISILIYNKNDKEEDEKEEVKDKE